MIRALLSTLTILAINLAAAAHAQQPPAERAIEPAEALEDAKLRLIPAINGELKAEDIFTSEFLQAVPPAQFAAISKNLITTYGPPVAISLIEKKSDFTGIYRLEMERGIARIELTTQPFSGRISGLFIREVTKHDDSIKKISAEFSALPGNAGFAMVQLTGDKAPRLIAGQETRRQFAVASTFKLYILAELSAQIARGERSWKDVIALSHRSFSANATRNWPVDSPVTLHTLALQMIAMSDNSASDTLLFALGRNMVEARLKIIGHSDRDRMLPLLATTEAFAMKGDSELRRQFLSANEAQQYTILSRNADMLRYQAINPYVFTSAKPKFIDQLEWFASPEDITRLMNALRAAENSRMLEIMSANVGPARSRRKQWNYLGYKGGSEPGVISMSYLMQANGGHWYALTGSWNDTKQPVDEARFGALMMRLMDILAEN